MMDKFYAFMGALIVMLALLSFAVFAQSDIPHQFAGTVTVNGAPAPDGTLVVAKVDGQDVAGTTTKNGQYGYDPVFFVPDPYRNRQGDTVEFYVSGVKGGEFIFENGGQTYLNLAVTVSQPPSPPPGGVPPGGGPGPIVAPPDDDEPETCTENWECTDWFECVSGQQKRTCTDLNSCGTEDNKPAEKQECSVKICDAGDQRCDGEDIVVCSQNEDAWVLVKTCGDCSEGLCVDESVGVTGFVIDGFTMAIAGIIVIVIIIAGLGYWKLKK
jgi:hypothetical protein